MRWIPLVLLVFPAVFMRQEPVIEDGIANLVKQPAVLEDDIADLVKQPAVLEDGIADLLKLPSVNRAIDAVCGIEDTILGR